MSRLTEDGPGPSGADAASGAAAAAAPGVAPAPARRRWGVGAVLQTVALVLGLGLLLGGFGLIALDYRPYVVPTGSMEPTIAAGDTVLARKVDGGPVGRGDIVVFHDPTWGNATLVKRVVAVGGDTVAYGSAEHSLTVNGKPVAEPYLAPDQLPNTPFSVQVPAGRLFLLGDNRGGSLDSRSHLDDLAGTVPASDVIARVEATVWPDDHAGLRGRTVAFDALGGPVASRPGPLVPAAWASVAGAVVIVLTSLTGPVAALGRRLRGRR